MASSQVKSTSVGKLPKFILVTNGPENEESFLQIPDRFIACAGDIIPKKVKLQFPNGRQIHVNYSKKDKSFTNLDLLYNEFYSEFGFFLVMSYNGEGIFSVIVIERNRSHRTEIEYEVDRKIGRAPVIYQDTLGGKGWNFLSYVDGIFTLNGSLAIPSGFLKRFRHIIPRDCTITLGNEDEMNIIYSRSSRRLYGLGKITQKMTINVWDNMLFTYQGNGSFDLEIYDKSRTEKIFDAETVIVDSSSENSSDKSENEEGRFDDISEDDDAEVVDRQFSKVLTRCNVDQSSRGVNIPIRVKPRNRYWNAGETVQLRTFRGSWPASIVKNGNSARFSAGWNLFSAANYLEEDQTLSFTLNKEAGAFVFDVEIYGD